MNDTYKCWSIFQSPDEGTEKFAQSSTGSPGLQSYMYLHRGGSLILEFPERVEGQGSDTYSNLHTYFIQGPDIHF